MPSVGGEHANAGTCIGWAAPAPIPANPSAGHAALGCLVTAPFATAGVSYTEDDAVALYALETRMDASQIPGEWPPDDTGSTGPWSMLALEKEGRIRRWHHTRNTHTALRLLNTGPISLGVPWFKSMFDPDGTATIHVDDSTELVRTETERRQLHPCAAEGAVLHVRRVGRSRTGRRVRV